MGLLQFALRVMVVVGAPSITTSSHCLRRLDSGLVEGQQSITDWSAGAVASDMPYQN